MRTTRTRKRRIERKQRRQRSSSLRRHLSLSLSYARACLYVYLQNARCVLCCVKSRFFRVFQKSKKNKTCGRSAFSLFPHILKEKPSPALYFLAREFGRTTREVKKKAERKTRRRVWWSRALGHHPAEAYLSGDFAFLFFVFLSKFE